MKKQTLTLNVACLQSSWHSLLPVLVDASVCFPFPSDPVTNFQGNLQGVFEAYLESCSLRHAAESLLAKLA
jgi:hypothetical protein